MEIAKYIYEGLVEPSYKNIPRKFPIVLVTAGIIEEKPARLRLTPRQERALASAKNHM